eukprot:CAMPEP_0174234030 /NCGR_PEP_ID=MMETSP0417-20130205/3905_1 /TAXON_ID=242541 /ORGANISM="Mayorella sp, Strain BSH-02190019" /LENGTH=59 /DNA_ID=CAMNT_0015312333 /DNA_START=188 /DNA_END=364 /DNA_ORIENTATION=-
MRATTTKHAAAAQPPVLVLLLTALGLSALLAVMPVTQAGLSYETVDGPDYEVWPRDYWE